MWNVSDVITSDYKVPDSLISGLNSDLKENFIKLLERDVYSEGDSQFLYDYVVNKLDISLEFKSMLEEWLKDELNHYKAMKRVYHAVSGVSYSEMDKVHSQRTHEIEPISELLKDEFTLLVSIMFDEIGSTFSYRRDLKEFYQHFGEPIRKVGLKLVQDEGKHFNWASEIVLKLHSHRLPELESTLNMISRLEKSLDKYAKTFLLDHSQEQYRFPKDFNKVIIKFIMCKLGMGAHPGQAALTRLWTWKPDNMEFTPI